MTSIELPDEYSVIRAVATLRYSPAKVLKLWQMNSQNSQSRNSKDIVILAIMKKTALLLIFIISANTLFAQSIPQKYSSLVKKADSLYRAKDYKNSAYQYSEAFESNGWKALATDRYNAACSWALSGVADSAFFQLNRIATKSNYTNYGHITTDTDLNSLHQDKRWAPLLEKIKQNKEKAEANLNKPLAAMLDSIYVEDQKYRQQIEGIEKKFGWDSKEMEAHWKIINQKDSINLIKVQAVLDKHGWLGADVVGGMGNAALFLVIQHADLGTQSKYLPMMREAVKNGKAQAGNLALLEDRVALGLGRKQIYGSQIGRDPETQLYYVSPLEDPDNVDKRRAEVGLGPLAEYLSYWQLKWDVEQYKKDLPKIEELQKRNR